MKTIRNILLIIVMLGCISGFVGYQTLADEKQELPKIILIVKSQGCKCTLEKCAETAILVSKSLEPYSGKLDYETIDYNENQQKVSELAKEYKIFVLPTLLFFDKSGEFKGKLDYSINKENVDTKLKEICKE